MNIVQLMEKANLWMLRFLKLIYLNILWVIGTIAGLGIFGIGPSTVALHCILRQWLQHNEDEPIAQSFIKYYKLNFKEASIIGMLYLAVGYILIVDVLVVKTWYFTFAIGVGIFIVCASLFYTPSLIAHYELVTIPKRLQMSLVLSFTYLQYTLIGYLLVAIVSLIVFSVLPALLPLIFVSGNGLIVSYFTQKVFVKVDATMDYDEKEKENSDE